MNINKISEYGLKYIQIPADKKGQELLVCFKNNYANKAELTRIKGVIELYKEWKFYKLKTPFLGVPENNDYWYLLQLYALDRQVNINKSPYYFDISNSEELYIENFNENDEEKKGNSVFKLLCKESGSLAYENTRAEMSREYIDSLLLKSGDRVVSLLGFDSKKYRLSLIPYDIYVRLSLVEPFFAKHLLHMHFDGYRKRPNGLLTGLYGGSINFGGTPYIDSLWKNTVNKSIIVRLVILRKDYGKK